MGLRVEIRRVLPGFLLDLDFSSEAKIIGILGNSGSGKTMSLRAIAGLEPSVRGRVELNGRTLFDSARRINLPPQRRHLGFLMQDYALFPHLTVAENVAFGLGRVSAEEAHARVMEQLVAVQLQGLEDRRPHQLSGGQQQRVALARALITKPEAILLDEPLSALDVHLRSQMEALLIETLSAFPGVALYVTHNLEEVYRLAEEIVILCNGKRVGAGTKEEVFRRPQTVTVAKVTGCKNFSRIRRIGERHVEALEWGCALRLQESVPEGFDSVGIRAHHLTFPANAEDPNTFPCALVRSIEGPFRMTLYLKLLLAQASAAHHHLQAEITRESWESLRNRPSPWLVRLDPCRIMPLRDDGVVRDENGGSNNSTAPSVQA